MYGDDRHRLTAIAVLVASSVCFALAHRLAFFDRGSGWMIDRSLSHRRFVMSGLAVACCAILVALAVGPSLPGDGNESLVAWRDIGNGWAQQDDVVTLAPLVSVRAQLVDQSDTEVFVVQSSQPEYWRLTALDSFDGTEWSAGSATVAAVTLPAAPAVNALRQVITIKALRGNWLPTAFAPIAVSIDDNTVVFDPDTATLRTEDRLGKNDRYVVWSNASEADGSAPTSSELSVPRALRQRLSALANQIVRDAGAVSVTDRARALEAYFLDNFTYDLNVAAGSSITDITSFLQRGSGYCEQFAATFAAMARVLGIPSRVAIGYRIGTYDAAENEYRVIGRDAHAWPELYVNGRGWVRFEPTPGSSGGSDAVSDAAGAAADAAPAAETTPDAPTTTVPAETPADAAADPTAVDGTATSSPGAGLQWVALVAALLLAVVALPVLIDRTRRRRGRQRAQQDTRKLIVWVWRDALRWLRVAGVEARATDTPVEVATRAAPVLTSAAAEIVTLAQLVTAACYAAADPTPADVEAARTEVENIRRCAKAQAGRGWRLRYYLAQVDSVVVHAGWASSSVAQPSSIS
jgi:transglutaminase-like putative cysteine protease